METSIRDRSSREMMYTVCAWGVQGQWAIEIYRMHVDVHPLFHMLMLMLMYLLHTQARRQE